MLARRSRSRVVGHDAPDRDELLELLSAAATVADHGRLIPWRVIEIRGDARLDLGRALAKADGKSGVSDKPLRYTLEFFETLVLTGAKKEIAERVIKEIIARLKFLNNVGLDYLSLDRSADTLSGGEAQRIRLASQIGSGLTGVMYVLDEPSIGLHQRDNDRLIGTLKHLRDIGNSVLVV